MFDKRKFISSTCFTFLYKYEKIFCNCTTSSFNFDINTKLRYRSGGFRTNCPKMFSVRSIVVILALGCASALPTKDVSANFGSYGIVPPIDDPLFPADIEVSLKDIPHFLGGFSVCSATVTGMSSLTDNLAFLAGGLGAVKVEMEFDLAHVEVNGVYTSDATLLVSEVVPELPDWNLKGRGAISANATNGHIKVSAIIPYVGNARITELVAEVAFDTAAANLEDALLNGEPMNWDEFNSNIKERFDLFWGANGGDITEAVRVQFNHIIENCTVAEIIAIVAGNGTTECLNVPPVYGNLASVIQNSGRIACRTIGYTCPAPTGSFPDPKDCASFFVCTNGIADSHQHCPDELLFNPLLSNCDFHWNVDCPVPEHHSK